MNYACQQFFINQWTAELQGDAFISFFPWSLSVFPPDLLHLSCDPVATLGTAASERSMSEVKDYRDEEVVIELLPHRIVISRVPVNTVLMCTYFTLEHKKHARNSVMMLPVLSCVLTLVRSHVYVSERRGRSRGAWAVTHQQQRIVLYQTPPPAAWAVTQAQIIQAVCFHISYNREDILVQLSWAVAPIFGRIGDARC